MRPARHTEKLQDSPSHRTTLWIGVLLALTTLAASCSSSTTEMLYFTSDRDGNLEVYSADPKEGTEANLTNSRMDEAYPRVSPDRETVAFVSGSGQDTAVEVMRSDGSERTPVTLRAGVHSDPRWSPDGKRIAYLVDRAGSPEIFMASADGTERVLLTTISGDEVGDWARNGKSVVFTVLQGELQGIYTRNPDGVNEVRLTDTPDYSPVWSPDSRRIAFLSTRDGNAEIYVMESDGSSQAVRLTDTEALEYDISWSPDGKKVLFVSERDGNPEIYILDPNGVEQTRLTYNNDRDDQPVWSPDGDRIAFVSYLDGDAEVFTMNDKGEDQVRITNNAAQDTNPTW